MGGAAGPRACVASHVALGCPRPARVEVPGQRTPSRKHPRSPAWMLGSLSEVHGLIPWMGCPFCPQRVLVASRQPQGLVEGLGV